MTGTRDRPNLCIITGKFIEDLRAGKVSLSAFTFYAKETLDSERRMRQAAAMLTKKA